MKKNRKLLLLAFELLCVAAILLGVFFFQRRAEDQDASLVTAEDAARRYRPALSYQGQSYPLKRNTSSLLLIGTDNFVGDSKQYEGLPYNFNLADFLVVLVFDHSAKTVTPFQICRDSMCEVPVTSGGTKRMQITLAHTYGSGKQDSCENVQKAAETLLLGVPIDSYLSFTMDTVPYINDLVGGVTVTLEDDIPALGPEYVKGATITLRGTSALRFVRYRNTDLLDDNLRRMSHHRLYLTAFADAARASAAKDSEFVTRVFKAVEKFICTNLSMEQVSDMLNNLNEYEILPAVTPDGEYVMGKEFAEYIVDETSLWDCVRMVFCM